MTKKAEHQYSLLLTFTFDDSPSKNNNYNNNNLSVKVGDKVNSIKDRKKGNLCKIDADIDVYKVRKNVEKKLKKDKIYTLLKKGEI